MRATAQDKFFAENPAVCIGKGTTQVFDSITSGFHEKLCPYCFDYFKMKDAPFVCDNDKCDYANDSEKKGCYHKSLFNKTKCPKCHLELRQRICPHCQKRLNIGFATAKKNLTFAIIGAKNVGKTHYFAVLIDQLRNLGGEINILVELVGDESLSKFSYYINTIKKQKMTVPPTNAGENEPLIIAISFPGKKRSQSMRSVSLSFFDTAGEDLNSEANLKKTNKYIAHADGILVLIDPLQLTWVRDRMRNNWLPEDEESIRDNLEILNRVTNSMTSIYGENYNEKKIPVPLAVAFNKFDALDRPGASPDDRIIEDEYNPLKRTPDHSRGFDVRDFEEMNSNMRALLNKWGNAGIVNIADNRYVAQGFFALSVLGCNPHENDQKLTAYSPKRVTDPFLWLLYYHGLIKAAPRK
jgi:hypothetical protein